MKNVDLINALKNDVLIFDGAMGTMLQNKIPAGTLPEILNVTNPDLIIDIHRQYVEAGSDIITANTFGANGLKFDKTEFSVEKIIFAAIDNAKFAGAKFAALDLGPLGQMLQPSGVIGFEQAVELFARQIRAAVLANADLILIETMSDLYEVKAAVIAAKENSRLPVVVSMTFDENLRTFMGCDAITAAVFLNAIGVDAIGVNCSRNPFMIAPVVDVFAAHSSIPVLVMPNAGLPSPSGAYSVTPDQFAHALTEYYEKGVSLFGGCCGTTPEHIAALTKAIKGKKPLAGKLQKITAVTSGTKSAVFDGRISVIGERINPTGKPKLIEAIKNNNLGFIINEAVNQEDAGADILDVNAGLPDINEAAALAHIVREIQSVNTVPLQIDSASYEAIESSVRIYNGKPLINSVNGTKESKHKVFPIAKKYGAAVVALTLDENEIPPKAEKRFLIAKDIIQTAESYGLKREDIIIDCLVLTASAQQAEVFETIKAIRLVKENLNVKTILGVSNVSFGLPNRPYLNGVFLTAALTAGLDAAIVNPMSAEITSVLKAFNVLNGNDAGAEKYIAFFSATSEKKEKPDTSEKDLITLVCAGQKDAAVAAAKAKLTKEEPLKIIDEYLIPALNIAGKEFEAGRLFLPQLVQSAETAKACFDAAREKIRTSDGLSKGKIVLATVKGDIHDIGKNIVKVLLQSYGYEVIDLGKDVEAKFVVEQAALHKVKLVGLSALMTTTITAMKNTIEALRISVPDCKIMVGGAVMSEQYTQFVGADFYAPDAMAGVKIAEATCFA